ncbi:CRISPR-associated helicase/endonuclease Cas3 [Ferroacidibacillus organovorans]|uniref:HD Cas3-type domain-containing protein n=1 Tax=Ferroacidibacillus organovorans TaxID=1765683 RepID=A0A1V4EXK7_9BACL|nr:CRISPR-associated helicase/endonuclease Cas3 [Ferroacidibacillus organovorans]OPG17666.1 hypothetical protein B2M26_00500 [Ferroacidibacillus organovorans]
MTILAKSAPLDDGDGVPFSATLYGHTRQCLDVARVFTDYAGEAMVEMFGIRDEAQIEWFRRALRWSAVLHDLGKATDGFARLLRQSGKRSIRPPLVRHEVVSYWISKSQPELDDAFQCAFSDLGTWAVDQCLLIRIAVLGHHLKFPRRRDRPEQYSEEPLAVSWRELEEDGVLGLLEDLAGRSIVFDANVPTIPGTSRWLRDEITAPFQDETSMDSSLWGDEIKLMGSLLRGALIAVDTVGSVCCRTPEEWEGVRASLENSFASQSLTRILEKAINKSVAGDEKHELSQFQSTVARTVGDSLIVQAGCGSGKTVAVLRRAQEVRAQGLFLTAPTTAVASQLYADYGLHMPDQAQLIHSRSVVDRELLRSPQEDATPDVEHGPDEFAAQHEAVQRLMGPITFCTVDLVLGLLTNRRASLALLPRLATSLIVFDEVHTYEPRLLAHLSEFLRVSRIPTVVMSASLPNELTGELERASSHRSFARVYGPKRHEHRARYDVQMDVGLESKSVSATLLSTFAKGERVLLVSNTVAGARAWYQTVAQWIGEDNVALLHAHFKYEERVQLQRRITESFRASNCGFCAVTTQICEVSFDVSADLLISELAPFTSMIQRLGRLNRRAQDGDPPRLAIFVDPVNARPYKAAEMEAGRELLLGLLKRRSHGISQTDLAEALSGWQLEDKARELGREGMTWYELDRSHPGDSLRTAGHTISTLLRSDLTATQGEASAARRLGKVLTLPQPKVLPRETWRYCYIVEDENVIYSPILGGRWSDSDG